MRRVTFVAFQIVAARMHRLDTLSPISTFQRMEVIAAEEQRKRMMAVPQDKVREAMKQFRKDHRVDGSPVKAVSSTAPSTKAESPQDSPDNRDEKKHHYEMHDRSIELRPFFHDPRMHGEDRREDKMSCTDTRWPSPRTNRPASKYCLRQRGLIDKKINTDARALSRRRVSPSSATCLGAKPPKARTIIAETKESAVKKSEWSSTKRMMMATVTMNERETRLDRRHHRQQQQQHKHRSRDDVDDDAIKNGHDDIVHRPRATPMKARLRPRSNARRSFPSTMKALDKLHHVILAIYASFVSKKARLMFSIVVLLAMIVVFPLVPWLPPCPMPWTTTTMHIIKAYMNHHDHEEEEEEAPRNVVSWLLSALHACLRRSSVTASHDFMIQGAHRSSWTWLAYYRVGEPAVRRRCR
jgi:hypothetical protein